MTKLVVFDVDGTLIDNGHALLSGDVPGRCPLTRPQDLADSRRRLRADGRGPVCRHDEHHLQIRGLRRRFHALPARGIEGPGPPTASKPCLTLTLHDPTISQHVPPTERHLP